MGQCAQRLFRVPPGFLWRQVPAAPTGHKLQCESLQAVAERVRRAFCISGQGQAAFKLHPHGSEGRDVIAATDISRVGYHMSACMTVFDQIQTAPSVYESPEHHGSAAALIRTIHHGIQEP